MNPFLNPISCGQTSLMWQTECLVSPHEKVTSVNAITGTFEEVPSAIMIVFSCTQQLGRAIMTIATNGYVTPWY